MKRFLGGIWPVVQREMRESARRPVNHRLRFWSAVGGTLVLWVVVASSFQPAAQLGAWLFACLHNLVLLLIFLMVPALTADCLAREQREGTLGLLFLTPLTAGGIVAGKTLTQAVRAFTLWLSVVPILIVPFLTGGITWFDTFCTLSLQFCAGVLCLGAGLLASTLARERNRVFTLAYLFAGLSLFFFTQVQQLAVWGGWLKFGALIPFSRGWWGMTLEFSVLDTGLGDFGGYAGWGFLMSMVPVLGKIWLELCCAGPAVALLLFWIIALLASRRLARSWQDKGPSPRRDNLVRTYCTPVFRKRFRRTMRRSLDWNPIAWLQQYSWQARLGKWLLCLGFLLVEWAAGSGHDARENASEILLFVLAGIYTFVGLGGFLEEKRSGVLELLLVTPISVNKLIFGRVVGLWGRFLPAAVALACLYVPDAWVNLGDFEFSNSQRGLFVAVCAFLSLPVFATYFALRVKNLILAAVLTWISLPIPLLVFL